MFDNFKMIRYGSSTEGCTLKVPSLELTGTFDNVNMDGSRAYLPAYLLWNHYGSETQGQSDVSFQSILIITCHDEKPWWFFKALPTCALPRSRSERGALESVAEFMEETIRKNAEKNTPGHGLLAKAKERGTAMLACDCCFFGLDIDDQVGCF